MSHPLNPKAPAEIPESVWKGIALAKRRLAVLGPQETGQEAARMSAFVLASEMRLASLPVEAAIELVRSLTFTADTTPRRDVIRQMERAARFAYNTKNGLPILTGCCRDPRPRSTAHTGGKLRGYFEPYCDDDCAKTCPMLKRIRRPDVALADTPFAPALRSNLWVRGAELGDCGKLTYECLANLALGEPDTEVWAYPNFLVPKLEGRYQVRQVRRVLTRMNELGLIEKRGEGNIIVRAPDADRLREIEQMLGVAGKRERNIAEALKERERLDDWAALTASQAGDEEAVAAWDVPAEERDSAGHIWQGKRNWGGLVYDELTCRAPNDDGS